MNQTLLNNLKTRQQDETLCHAKTARRRVFFIAPLIKLLLPCIIFLIKEAKAPERQCR